MAIETLAGLTAGQALLGGSLISGTSSLVGGKKGAKAATDAASIQAQAAREAALLQQQRFMETKEQLMPFIDFGKGVIPTVQQLTGTAPGMDPSAPLTAPLTRLPDKWDPTMEQLEKTPGYQFTLQQGLRATQSGYASRGLASSPAALRGAADYATGLASTTYNQQFSNWLQQQNLALQGQAQTYNQLTGQVGTGLQAAGALGGVAVTSGERQGQFIANAGAATAGGVMGGAQAQIGGMQGFASSVANPLQMFGTMAMMKDMGLFKTS